jgi:hypothetical protein
MASALPSALAPVRAWHRERRAPGGGVIGPAGPAGSRPPAASSRRLWPDNRDDLGMAYTLIWNIFHSCNAVKKYENTQHELKIWCNSVVLGHVEMPVLGGPAVDASALPSTRAWGA